LPKKRVSLQAKHLRQSRKRRLYNSAVKSGTKTAVTGARAAIVAAAPDAAKVVSAASRTLDKAATKGVIHARTAARKKSRLALQLNKALAANKTS
jgi:small subunit ribosomal protein S20